MNNNILDIIYLQTEEENKTWCEDKINNSDEKYISENHLIEYLQFQIDRVKKEQSKITKEADPTTHLAFEISYKTMEVLIEEINKMENK